MRNEKAVKELIKRYEKVKQKRQSKIVEELAEIVFARFEAILEKDLAVDQIVFERNPFTKCIDITFCVEEFENIVKSIENSELLMKPTDVQYFELTIEFWHEKMKVLGFVEDEVWSGAYNEDIVSFVVKQ